MENEPLSKVVWVDAFQLFANDYNPNVVFNKELELLELSILKSGWIQPILIDNNKQIIDGFHRWHLAKTSNKLKEKYGSKTHGAVLVPCVVLDITEPERMLLTIRINRAKGSHIAFKMADIVKKLVDTHCYTFDVIAQSIGANKDEIALLYEDSIFKRKNIQTKEYSKAWVPV